MHLSGRKKKISVSSNLSLYLFRKKGVCPSCFSSSSEFPFKGFDHLIRCSLLRFIHYLRIYLRDLSGLVP